eukprot:TRINITY_DN10111_c0_g1_i1.p1 TRINITY_DN10111_c0_g1~~TRINITY_DN10111_c0_g1_i1.p1  ORF type:complete len:369 (-),score=103.51 TRINITY_DN10111_c0_g1_i1:53-1159(-)
MGQCFGKKAPSILRVLILGISGCGKSTFVKQLKVIHQEDPFTEDQLAGFVEIIRMNVIVGLKELIELATLIGKEDNIDQDNMGTKRFLRETTEVDIDFLENKEKLYNLWNDPAIQNAFKEGKKRQMQMSQLKYFMNPESWERIIDDEYRPTSDDIVRARQRTTGAYATRLTIEKHVWEFVDVGGQVPERTKWRSIVGEGVQAVIYFAAMDEFNTASTEEDGLTKMEISRRVWKDICNDNTMFGNCLILFLNKQDLFEEKFFSKKGRKSFSKIFSDFDEYFKDFKELEIERDPEFANIPKKEQELEASMEYVAELFREEVNYELEGRTDEDPVNIYTTCAIDTNAIEVVFDKVKDKIFMDRMKASGIAF